MSEEERTTISDGLAVHGRGVCSASGRAQTPLRLAGRPHAPRSGVPVGPSWGGTSGATAGAHRAVTAAGAPGFSSGSQDGSAVDSRSP